MKIRRKKRVVLALGAGSARGLAHIGVLKALTEAGIPIDAVAGVSFGAIVGSLYCIYKDMNEVGDRIMEYMKSPFFQDAHKEITSLERGAAHSFFERIQATFKKGYFYTKAINNLSILTQESFVMNISTLCDNKTFADMKIPFKCQATDLITGNPIVFSEGNLCTALQASSAIPGYFPPINMHDMLLEDGGVAEMLPVHLAKTFNPDYIIGVNVRKAIEPLADVDNEITNTFDVIFRSYDITRDFMDIYLCRELDCIITPDIHSQHWYDFGHYEHFVTQGYKAAKAKIKEIIDDIYWIYR
jgi:NTE family protein